MTLASLSERKLHPFFSFQQRNCFQRDCAGPYVIWLHCLLSPQMRENAFLCEGQNCGFGTASAVQDRTPAQEIGGSLRGGRAEPPRGRRDPTLPGPGVCEATAPRGNTGGPSAVTLGPRAAGLQRGVAARGIGRVSGFF